MSNLSARVQALVLVIFVLSGFSGLVYQSVWSHYLGLTLGHAAYAQSLVLAIFMGGMALGAALAGRRVVRWSRVLLAYAVAEALIGLGGLIFHPVFAAYAEWSVGTAIPAIGSPGAARAFQWGASALLILPQSVLLGATFPLMSAALLRVLPYRYNEVLGGLYFANSLGAAAGAVIATFVLVPKVGLPGALMAAGLLNLLVALGAWGLSKKLEPLEVATPGEKGASSGPAADPALLRVVLWATALSGASSFVYEIGWIRMLNQALGSTIHSFELMLAAFIAGLAFGGLWVRRRGPNIVDPLRYAGFAQIWMGVAALLSLPVFAQSFDWVAWVMSATSRTSEGYRIFEVGSATIAILVMFPAAFFAGMTLPLFTSALLRQGGGERAIGWVYAANTLGAIGGVLLMVHALIPAIGVRLAVTLAALVDVAIGVYLVRFATEAGPRWRFAAASLVAAGAAAFSLVAGAPDPSQQVSGVFRTGTPRNDDVEIVFLRDGKTATVSAFRRPEGATISTNGKPDASIMPLDREPSFDEHTMVMLGLMPLVLHPSPERVAVIGWGSGLSTHTLLGSRKPSVVDTIEIEPAMWEGARIFLPNVERAYTDPRSKVRFEDARTFLALAPQRYDVIVSEPSNPWVSGVSSLFTREFYRFLASRIEPDGMLVQWLHAYEIDDPLFATMMAALISEFPHTEVYAANASDFVVIGRRAAPRAPLLAVPSEPWLAAELRRVGLDTTEALALRRIGGSTMLPTYVEMYGARPHSDYYPVVAHRAPVTRYSNSNATALLGIADSGLPVLDVLECRSPVTRDARVSRKAASPLNTSWHLARDVIASLEAGRAAQDLQRESADVARRVDALLAARTQPTQPAAMTWWSDEIAALAPLSLSYLPASELATTWAAPHRWVPSAALGQAGLSDALQAYASAASRDPVAMRNAAIRALQSPSPTLGPRMREQLLVFATAGSAALDLDGDVEALEARYGQDSRVASSLVDLRAFIRAWSKLHGPARCGRAVS